jgi:hypothetical protein
MKTKLQKQRGWIQTLPESKNAILVVETKLFRLPKGLSLYNTALNLNGNHTLYVHLVNLFEQKAVDYNVSNFSIAEDSNIVRIQFKTTTYTNSKAVKLLIDNLYSALLAVYRLEVSKAKIASYEKYGNTSLKNC